MKNLLIITYYFPPDTHVGANRPFGLVKYLPQFGWNPFVLTPQKPGRSLPMPVIETSDIDILAVWKEKLGLDPSISVNKQFHIIPKKNQSTFSDIAKGFLDNFILFPDSLIGWKDFAIETGDLLIRDRNIDAILSTSYPPTVHVIAKKLSEMYNLPWIADFRDLWTQNPYNSNLHSFFQFLRGGSRFERKILRSSAAITTISPPLAEKLRTLHRNKIVYSIPNGYDPDDVPSDSSLLSKKFTITHTGSLYRGKRDPSMFFQAVSELILNGDIDRDTIEIRLYGSPEPWLENEISQYNLSECVKIIGIIPKSETIQKQRESQILLLILWNHPMEIGTYTGKIFEYLAARRPILALNGPSKGVVRNLLADTHAGEYITSSDILKEKLLEFYREYQTSGFVQFQGRSKRIEKYSSREMAKKFADLLNFITI